jgi:3-phosphoshikimate 1-carboxyvinyltransferase
MGAIIDVSRSGEEWEPSGDMAVTYGPLTATTLEAEDVVRAIDEVPLVALLATQAAGRTEIRGAAELRKKESDRIRGTVRGLAALGAEINETDDGMVVQGPCQLTGAEVSSEKDHRLAIMLAVAGLAAKGRTTIADWEWSEISYPRFSEVLRRLGARAYE